MKKVYKMQDLDCANCAAKMENAIRKIEGVEECNISFMTQRLTVVCAEAKLEEIMNKAIAAVKKVDPDCRILV